MTRVWAVICGSFLLCVPTSLAFLSSGSPCEFPEVLKDRLSPWLHRDLQGTSATSTTTWMTDPNLLLETTSSIATSAASQLKPILPPTVLRSMVLGGFPALGMLLATNLGLRVPTPPNVLGALQHFAAGILLTTVAKELLPEMVNAEGPLENLASGIGFFSGVGVLIILGILLPEEDEEEEHAKTNAEDYPSTSQSNVPSKDSTAPKVTGQLKSLRNRKASRKAGAVARSASVRSLGRLDTTEKDGSFVQQPSGGAVINEPYSAESTAPTETVSIDKAGASPRAASATSVPALKFTLLPAALLAAVSIDSALDGLLIGTSTALDPSTGSILSASLAVESSFLGLTIGTALQSCAPNQGFLGSTFAPVSLFLAATAGGFLAPTLTESPVLLAGILGFGTSATLFMVAEELLLESHENGADHVWWVDFQLYTGFFASVMVDKLL